MSLDIESTELINSLIQLGLKPIHQMTPAEARNVMAFARSVTQEPAMYRVEDVQLDTARLRVYVPTEVTRGVILYIHGGGWVLGGLDDFDHFARLLAKKSDCTVVLLEYRLAPEFPFPAALLDIELAHQWITDQRHNLTGLDRPPLIIAGDSAGGNLAAVSAQRASKRGLPRWDAQVLIYPVTQSNLDMPGYHASDRQLLLSREDMRWFWNHYLADAGQRALPAASPLATDDLRGLPPAIVVTAEFDVLREEGQAYVDHLQAASIEVSHKCFDGQMHGFMTFLTLRASTQALDWVADQIGRRLDAL
ncbi:alpha/beta hydrolase [Pseudomonas sp. RGM2987]|uniref:alpha/beta hydrolase n=1 Tax=Pseudomonas sp. RGM2987 TaxID=2930090 RepID=UPI001FD68C41|nr:alpha/beta hydrolase [Pseudomonas sp. RGM2987]MCJ8206779.1 alpha/beta hydrolase [Pseudomonas sp. RGM2987]